MQSPCRFVLHLADIALIGTRTDVLLTCVAFRRIDALEFPFDFSLGYVSAHLLRLLTRIFFVMMAKA